MIDRNKNALAWNTRTIAEMEETARKQSDGSASKRINGKWLDVTVYEARGPVAERITYLYHSKQITRERAIELNSEPLNG